MEVLKIEGTRDIPEVLFDSGGNNFKMSGRSCPEDVAAFFRPILDWLNNYLERPNEKTILEINMDYFNTASAKMLLNILQKFEKLYENGHEVLIKWYFPEDDEDMEEAGEDYADIVEVPFEFISFEVED